MAEIIAAVAVCVLMFYPSLSPIVMIVAQHSFRVRSCPDQVSLKGLDGPVVLWFGFVALGSPVAFAFLGWQEALAIVVVAQIFWAGLRVEVVVSKGSSTIQRLFLFAIRWRKTVVDEELCAYVDGWGDWADPTALCVARPSEKFVALVELGWAGKDSGDLAERLATEFNQAVESRKSGRSLELDSGLQKIAAADSPKPPSL